MEDRPGKVNLWRDSSRRPRGIASLLGLPVSCCVLGLVVEGDGFVGVEFGLGGEVERVTEEFWVEVVEIVHLQGPRLAEAEERQQPEKRQPLKIIRMRFRGRVGLFRDWDSTRSRQRLVIGLRDVLNDECEESED